MKVSNGKCIANLSLKNMKASRTRNVVAVIAISLTALLFSSLFTIVMSISKGVEYSNFRQVGSCAHGEFKRLTKEQFQTIKEDKAIDSYGVRRILGIGVDEVLWENYTEVSYMDKNSAEWGFVTPTTGTLPKENTQEAAADTRFLAALGVEKKIGTRFSVTIDVDGTETTEQFVLSGWWEFDGASRASNLLIPESRLEQIFEKLDTRCLDEMTGRYSLTVMLKKDKNIEGTLKEILTRQGFSQDSSQENYIAIGVNWGYMSESMEDADAGVIGALAALVLIIVLTGYLIIYNVFRISVSNDIRYYGMLKTIGTTGRQIRRIILIQAVTLSAFGIPLGLLPGWAIGAKLTPVVLNEMNVYKEAGVSGHPVIFLFAAVFALVTVLLSAFEPGRIAASVSPIEALRYTEATAKQHFRKGKKGISIPGMAAANLAGNKKKTILTVGSLSLSVVLFTLTVIFVNSFSMEKYLEHIAADFVVADASYYNVYLNWDESTTTEEDVEPLKELPGVTKSFSAYGVSFLNMPESFYTEAQMRDRMKTQGYKEEEIDLILERASKNEMGGFRDAVQMIGMEPAGFDQIKVLEGDIQKAKEEGYIAIEKSEYYSLGDKITLCYTDSLQCINTVTGEVYENPMLVPDEELKNIEHDWKHHEVVYEICAVVEIPGGLGYNYSIMSDVFLMDAERFKNEVKDPALLYFAMDVEDESEAEVERFLESYTENGNLDYNSRAKMAEEFKSFRRMFLILGGSMSLIVGLVGVLNVINTVLTGIVARRKELATLQAIGMTGKQLKNMLTCEGLLYTGGAAVVAVALNLLTVPMAGGIEKIFWFCEYKFTFVPSLVAVPAFAVVGILVPVITYAMLCKKSVVERLREGE